MRRLDSVWSAGWLAWKGFYVIRSMHMSSRNQNEKCRQIFTVRRLKSAFGWICIYKFPFSEKCWNVLKTALRSSREYTHPPSFNHTHTSTFEDRCRAKERQKETRKHSHNGFFIIHQNWVSCLRKFMQKPHANWNIWKRSERASEWSEWVEEEVLKSLFYCTKECVRARFFSSSSLADNHQIRKIVFTHFLF